MILYIILIIIGASLLVTCFFAIRTLLSVRKVLSGNREDIDIHFNIDSKEAEEVLDIMIKKTKELQREIVKAKAEASK